MPTELIADDDIIVTSATRVDAEPAAGAGAATEKPVEEKPGGAAAADAAAAGDGQRPAAEAKMEPASGGNDLADLTAEEQAELDKIEPPKADETPDQRVARNRRATKQVLKQIARRKEAENDRDRLQRENDELRRGARAPDAPPPAGDKAGAPPAAGPAASEPEFKFHTWEEHQETHPDATYEDYQDARTDARYEWNRTRDAAVARVARARDTDARLAQEFTKREDAFKAEHPDYDDVIDAFRLPRDVPDEYTRDFQRLMVASEVGPHVLYHLSQAENVEDVTRILSVRSRPALVREFGRLEGILETARRTAKPAPAGGAPADERREPSKPATDAPAPVRPVPGGAHGGRTPHDLAHDDDDADSYIAERTRQGAGLRRG